jgi:hypothetical protein
MQTLNNTFNTARRVLMMTFFLALTGCAVAAKIGEWFTVGIGSIREHSPRLEKVSLASNDGFFNSDEEGSFSSFGGMGSKEKMPDVFTFRWQVKGATHSQEKVFQVRSKLPVEVIQKLQSTERPVHSLSLNFRVNDGKAECVWSLARLETNNPIRIAEGVIR